MYDEEAGPFASVPTGDEGGRKASYSFASEIELIKSLQPQLNGNDQETEEEQLHGLFRDNSCLRRGERQKNNVILVYEIDGSNGKAAYKEMTLKSLLTDINSEIEHEYSSHRYSFSSAYTFL